MFEHSIRLLKRAKDLIPGGCSTKSRRPDNAIDRIILHLKLTFAAERPPPPQAQPQLAMAAEERAEYL